MSEQQMSEDEMKQALEHDEAIKAAVEKNKEQNAEAAQRAGVINAASERLSAKVKRAQDLKVELAEFPTMDAARRQEFAGKAVEYLQLRLDLAMELTVGAVCQELAIHPSELSALAGYTVNVPAPQPSVEDRVARLEKRLDDLTAAMLNR